MTQKIPQLSSCVSLI